MLRSVRTAGPAARNCLGKAPTSATVRPLSTCLSNASANANASSKSIARLPTSPLRIAHQRYFSGSAIRMTQKTRTETDAFGEVQVAADRYWGAQTERSLENFRINQPQDRMPPPIVKAFGILKGAAATVNMRYGLGIYNFSF